MNACRLGIAVGKVQTREEHAADGGLDIPRLLVFGIAGQRGQYGYGLLLAEQGHTIPGSLPDDQRVIAGLEQHGLLELRAWRLQLLKRHHIGL
jgi:hypothetical protein